MELDRRLAGSFAASGTIIPGDVVEFFGESRGLGVR
jgi:hypothetical protein